MSRGNADGFGYLSRILLDEIQCLNDVLAITGLFFTTKTIIKFSVSFSDFIKTHILSKVQNPDLTELFGEWAVVTGSSEGIGKAYAEELAIRGLNIVLISNDVQQLQNAALEINEKYGVQVDFIDITLGGDPSIYPKIKEALRDKVIGILVNNVGITYDYPQFFLDVPEERIWQLINVNIATATMMTHMILPDMVSRGKGAVVNVAAGACSRPIPQLTVYAATKAYLDLFSRALNYEYKDRGVIVQSLMPYYVATKMLRYSRTLSKPSTLIPTAQKYASHAVQTLGHSSRTTGYWPHTIQAWLASLLPERVWMWGATRLNSALRRQALERMKSQIVFNA